MKSTAKKQVSIFLGVRKGHPIPSLFGCDNLDPYRVQKRIAGCSTQLHAIIKSDCSQVLRFNYLHYSVDTLLREEPPPQDNICLFYDSQGSEHIFSQNTKKIQPPLQPRSPHSYSRTEWTPITQQQASTLSYSAHPLIAKYLSQSKLQKYRQLTMISLDQIRCKCIANTYMDPEHLIADIFNVVGWNQIYRTKTYSSFLYMNRILENVHQIINKKKVHKKFAQQKAKDFQKLLTHELRFKVEFETWPYIPEKFREYAEIDEYVPTPENRTSEIEKRLLTKKQPVECPDDCVCVCGVQNFCEYTLKDGWVTKCPNRANKVECNHKDPELMKKCKNAEIKKGEKKKCKTNQDDKRENLQIEQCIMWGIDYYTRHMIYHSLPEVDIVKVETQENKDEKNKFIQFALLKAINFNRVQGYNLRKACELILKEDDKIDEKTQVQKKIENNTETLQNIWRFQIIQLQESKKNQNKGLFSSKDKYYAEVLLQNYIYCIQKIDSTAFRIHTKGKGARCINKEGIKQGSFIVEYYGQLYEPWRWYQRQDFIKQVMKNKKLKNYIPQFYNIYLEPHNDDPDGYDLMVVDPNKMGNYSSRFSHSCTPNCGTVTTVSNGKYYIGMYSFRDIQYGEQLTFDYCCMTESSYEHLHSICLCGTHRCRGNYLQLANSKTYSMLVDKNTCFFSRNSLILQALEDVTEEDLKLCAEFNIKSRMFDESPEWIKKWSSKLLKYILQEMQIYKSELVSKWTKDYPWGPTTPEAQAANIELYAETSKNDLFQIRFQNLFTTVDKLKYFLNSIDSTSPPLYYLSNEEIIDYMITNRQSILKEIQQVLIQQQRKQQAFMLKKFMQVIEATTELPIKLFYFRLCCLCVSHMCLQIKQTHKFNSLLLADILHFYAFTHTYFTARQYESHVSEQIKVALSEITGNVNDKHTQKIKRRYSSQFIWGQLVSWYKQTIVAPQASLSQDRRGTLSYPMIKSIINSVYPFQKHCRKNFYKALREKSSTSWPSAPNHGCLLSFKNPFKCYGTVFFESIHNAEKFKDLFQGTLQENVINLVNQSFDKKLQLFKKVQNRMQAISDIHEAYNILSHIQTKYFNFTEVPKIDELAQQTKNRGEQLSKPKKKRRSRKSQDDGTNSAENQIDE